MDHLKDPVISVEKSSSTLPAFNRFSKSNVESISYMYIKSFKYNSILIIIIFFVHFEYIQKADEKSKMQATNSSTENDENNSKFQPIKCPKVKKNFVLFIDFLV